MKKIIILLGIIYILANQLFAVTHTVGHDSEYDFQSIQSAIDLAVNGDSIIVYPGIYYENIDFLGKSLFLGSLYSLTADTSDVSQTIIDGQKQATVIALKYVDQATIEGFTVQNGKGSYDYDDYELQACGGIYAYNSTLDLNYNIIKENISTVAGGIGLLGSNAFLKGNQIYKNRSLYSAGGVLVSREHNGPIPEVIFDPIEKNSVYFNVSQYYNDIYFLNFEEVDISLKKSTFSYHTPYNIFVKSQYGMPTNINISIEEGFFEEINADLYVSVDGDDSNSGLSPEDPLRSITMAIFKQKEDSLDIKTIYVTDGVYSEETGNMFPLKLKRYTKLIGESRDNTIIDCGGISSGFVSGYLTFDTYNYNFKENITIEKFKIINTCNEDYYVFSGQAINLRGKSENNIYNIHNIIFDNTADEAMGQGGFEIGNTDIVRISNVYFKREVRNLFETDVRGISIFGSEDGLLENIIVDGGNVGLTLSTERRIIHEYGRITVSNALLKNLSTQAVPEVDFYTYSVNVIRAKGSRTNESGVYDDIRIINSTIYNNSGLDGIINGIINLNIDFYNCIIYGNTPYNTISLGHTINGTLGGSVFSHNLFEHPSYGIVAVPLWDFDFINNIVGDPMFVGNGMYPEALSTGSPAINAGTLDIPDYEFPEYDLAGNPRIFDGQIDIGAYEYQSVTNNEIELPKPENKISFYPNPINLSKIKSNIANIDLEIAEAGDIHLAIYNIKGQRVKTLISGKTKVGGFNMFWDGLDDDKNFVSSGVYFIKAKINDKEIFKKFTIIK